MMQETLKCGAPDSFDRKQQTAFIELVKLGAEVSQRTLRRNVPRAECLAFLWLDDVLSGVAALKKPQSTYREGFLGKSGAAVGDKAFPFELGYVFIIKSAQGKGYSRKLVAVALADYGHSGIFATSHTTNEAMHKTLARFGFVQTGNSWNGKDAGKMIQLFLRRGEQPSC
jgi:GNAT superfamily N-acetyltransferase